MKSLKEMLIILFSALTLMYVAIDLLNDSSDLEYTGRAGIDRDLECLKMGRLIHLDSYKDEFTRNCQ